MSEPARNASALLAEALKPGASLDQITLALEAILAVTAKGLGGDASAYAQYQALLLELHVGSDPHTEPTRRWMASQVYLVEDRFAPEPAGFSAVPVEEFRKKVDAEIEARSRVRHPMSVHLFQGTPPVEDVRFFLEHHWVRSYNFYSLLAGWPSVSKTSRTPRCSTATSTARPGRRRRSARTPRCCPT